MVPTDGSGFDREAIRVALRIAERSEARIKLVRVLSTGSFFGVASASEGTSLAAEVVRSEREKALTELYALAVECRANSRADISVDLHAGPVADILGEYARRKEIDLIVISTHGRTGLSRLSLGSVTDSLIRHTSIPVLVVKPSLSYLNPEAATAFRRIVVPLDGSTLAEQILPRVLALAALDESEITLLHILTPQLYSPNEVFESTTGWSDKDISIAQEYLLRMGKKLRREGVPVRTDIVVSDNVAEAIGDFAARDKADLIAIATHGRGGLERMLRGSVADAVMHSANRSMLVFKPERFAEQKLETSEQSVGASLSPA